MCKDFIKQNPLGFVKFFTRDFTTGQASSSSGSLHKEDCFANWCTMGKRIYLEEVK